MPVHLPSVPRLVGTGVPSAFVTLAVLVGCEGPQSALSPAGRDAELIARLFWWMAGGALAIWLAVVILAIYAAKRKPNERARKNAQRFLILGSGALFPTVVLLVLLTFGLSLMPPLLDFESSDDQPTIHVRGEQWWWRVRYELPSGDQFELANELRLPVGSRQRLSLESRDVIHALWVPSLAGKVDMIPGRINEMALEPTRSGIFRGVCAEYCGRSHAQMALHVVALDPEEFLDWTETQRASALAPIDETARTGSELFLSLGCGACHAIRGTPADGTIGPDLTHVGSRAAVAGGVVENDVAGFRRWLSHTDHEKPGAYMPTFDMLSGRELHALATYLEALQ